MSLSTLSAPPRQLDRLTIGIELEFIVILPAARRSGGIDDNSGEKVVQRALKECRFSKECHVCGRIHTHELPLATEASPDESDPAFWEVNIDPTVQLSPKYVRRLGGHFNAYCIEVKSRALFFDGTTPCPAQDIYHDHHGGVAEHTWALELEAVNSALQELGRRENTRVLTNATAGLHIHVGNGNRGIHHDVARSLIGIFTAFERQFDSLNITKRIGGGGTKHLYPPIANPTGTKRVFNYDSENDNTVQEQLGWFCKPMSSLHITKVEVKDNPADNPLSSQVNVKAWLQLLRTRDTAASLNWLTNSLQNWHTSAVNIERVWDEDLLQEEPECVEGFAVKPTLEFRSHFATLQLQEQKAWIVVVSLLTKFCYARSEDSIFDWLEHNWSRYNFTFIDLLSQIGADDELRAFYSNFIEAQGFSSFVNDRANNLRQQELSRNDSIADSGIILDNIQDHVRLASVSCVREKIKSKFYRGLYGKYPEAFVKDFLTDHGDLSAYLDGLAESLILP